jgi:hypothetical protein
MCVPVPTDGPRELPQNHLRVLELEDASQEAPESGTIFDIFTPKVAASGQCVFHKVEVLARTEWLEARSCALDTHPPTSEADKKQEIPQVLIPEYFAYNSFGFKDRSKNFPLTR